MKIDDHLLYEGQNVQIIKASNQWDWWSSHIGEVYPVLEIRERYDDVIVGGDYSGNCIDIDCVEIAKDAQ